MYQNVSECIHVILLLAFGGAAVLSAVLYIGRHKTVSLCNVFLFSALILREIQLHSNETNSSLAIWLDSYFSTPVILQSILYIAILLLLLIFVCGLISERFKLSYLIVPALVSVWMLVLPMLSTITVFNTILYILPLDLFYLGLSLWGIIRLRKRREEFSRGTLNAMAVMAALSLFAVLEDVFYALPWGFTTIFAEQYQPRSFSESALFLTLAVTCIWQEGKAVCHALDCQEEAEDEDGEDPDFAVSGPTVDERMSGFADSLGLTSRERDILALLLTDKSNKEISEELFISVGTVKTHTHNIFQKAEVDDRRELIRRAREFAGS